MKQHRLMAAIAVLLAAAVAPAAEPLPLAVPPPALNLPPANLQAQPLPPAQPASPASQLPPAAAADAGGKPASSNPSQPTLAPPRPGLTLADLKAQFPLSKEGHFQMEVPSILNTSTDREAQVLLEGKSLETTGQVMAETVANPDGTSLRITRSQLLCCSAHARQCSIALKFSGNAPAFNELAWVKLVGTVTYKREGLKTVPCITVQEIKEIAAPANQLLQ